MPEIPLSGTKIASVELPESLGKLIHVSCLIHFRRSGDDSAALDCYNQAVVLAPCSTDTFEGEDLAIALANRAAVFLRQEKFNLCLIDIELAKKSGYPKVYFLQKMSSSRLLKSESL